MVRELTAVRRCGGAAVRSEAGTAEPRRTARRRHIPFRSVQYAVDPIGCGEPQCDGRAAARGGELRSAHTMSP